ncbi:tyrosine-type recombinase/integrase [Neisseria sp. Ec49-e6-T10]|uniref:tyrosine-type recombinase/integrase n=1 Tax=Neisseria sp. Ec49-e6-T10 TaxID=3140744 RepID=UPI003EB923FC
MKIPIICGLVPFFLLLCGLCSGGALDDFLKEPWTPSGQVIVHDQDTIDVIAQMTPEIKDILDVVKSLTNKEIEYVFVTKKGEPFTASGLRSAWNRACERVGIKGITLKDIRPKSLTDASLSGFELKQLSVIAAHSDTKTTEGYIKKKETPVSEVKLTLPDKKNDV